MARGRKPGMPKIGGRQKGTRNKFSIGKARDQVTADAPDLDPLVRMRTIAQFFEGQAAIEREKMRKNEHFDRKFMNDCLERAAKVWRELGPYKHPRLNSLKVDGTMKHDLSALSDAELVSLRRIVGKTQMD